MPDSNPALNTAHILLAKQIQHLSVGIAVLNAQGQIVQINPCLAEHLGYPPQELVGTAWEDLMPPDDRAEGRPDYLDLERLQEGPYRIRRRFMTAQGQIIWATFSLEDLNFEHYVQLVWEDITEQREHDLMVDQDQAILQALISSLDDMVFLFSDSGQIIRSWGRSSSAFAGFADQLVGRSVEQLFDEDLSRMFRNAFTLALSSQLPQRIEYPSFQTHIWYEATVSPVHLPQGEDGVSLMLKNISRRKSAEISLKRFQEGLKTLNQISYKSDITLKQRLQQGLELMLHYFFLHVGQIVKFETGQGILLEEVTRQHHPTETEDITWQEHMFALMQKQGGSVAISDLSKEPLELQDKLQDWPFQSYFGALIQSEGQELGLVCFYSERVYPEDMEDNDREFLLIFARWISFILEQDLFTSRLIAHNENKDRIMDLIAHDLRNPLGAISGLAEYTYDMDAEHLNDNVKVALSGIIKASQRAQDLLEALLQTERFEAQRQPLNRVPIPFQDLLQRMYFENLQKAHELNVKLEIEINFEAYANVDTVWLTQVLENLIGNAFKFTPEQGRVRLILQAHNEAQTFVRCTIEDSGLGIPEKLRPFLFQKFTDAKRLGVRGEPTTGLGLYLVKHIIEQHHGRIWFEPHPEAGSRFSFCLPVVQPDAYPVVSSGRVGF